MAKNNGNKGPEEVNGAATPPAAYFKSLTIENVKCFKGEHTIDLSDGNGKPAQWTVILGNNNTGKTTILKCLAGLDAVQIIFDQENESDTQVVPRLYGAGYEGSISDFFVPLRDRGMTLTSFVFLNYVKSQDLRSGDYEIFRKLNSDEIQFWGIKDSITGRGTITSTKEDVLKNLFTFSYGATRRMSQGKNAMIENYLEDTHSNLFNNSDLSNVEDWLLNLLLAETLGQERALKDLNLAKKVLNSGILPDVSDLRIRSGIKGPGFENFVEFKTDFGWIRLRELGYGYQTMITWVLDLVKRMVERYPNAPNPLAEPAIVLVDEIDLHLHPDWQRKIIAHLTKHFPNTQFIVTAHSPLVVQSADEVNVVILKKESDSVSIEQPKLRSFKGWTVEEILTDLMQLEGQTMSQTYIDLREQFDEALDEDDYAKAKDAFDKLVKILHPTSTQRKLMQLQMTSLSPEAAI